MTDPSPTSPPAQSGFQRAFHSVARYRGALELGWYDFVARFRRSWLGPLWSPIQMALFVAVLVVIFERGDLENGSSYVLYLAVGFYAWDFISASVTEGAVHFTSQASLMKNTRVDISYMTVRKISFIFCRSLLNAPIPIIAVFFFGGVVNANTLMILLAPIVFAGFTYGCLIIFGILGAFFADFGHLTQTATRFLFFTTPIFWYGDVGLRKVISDYNPFSYYIEFVRAPLRGEIASPMVWLVVCASSLLALLIALWTQKQFKTRLVYRL